MSDEDLHGAMDELGIESMEMTDEDYAALDAAGRLPYLTIGPWYHGQPGGLMTGLREGPVDGLGGLQAEVEGIGTRRGAGLGAQPAADALGCIHEETPAHV